MIFIGNPLNLSLKFLTCCLTKRVVGAIKPYSNVSDKCANQIYNISLAPRIVLDSKPKFFGIGTPESGVLDATIIMALFEMDYEVLGSQLVSSKWSKDPIINNNLY